MKLRYPLYLQATGMLFLYLATLSAIAFIGFNAQFGIGYDALFNSPIGDRFDTIADSLRSQLQAVERDKWDGILNNFEQKYKAKFEVVDFMLNQVAGEKTVLPPELMKRLAQFPHPHPGGLEIIGPGGKHLPPPFFDEHGPEDFHGPPPEEGAMVGRPPDMPSSFALDVPPPDDYKQRDSNKTDKHNSASSQNSDTASGAQNREQLEFQQHFSEKYHRPGWQRFHFRPRFGNVPPEMRHAFGRFMLHTENPNRFWFTAKIFIKEKGHEFTPPGSIIASTENLWQSTILLDFPFLALVFACILGFSVLFWAPFIYRITTALSQLSEATGRIADGRFDIRLKTNGADEIGQLSQAVNVMAGRLSNFVSGQKRFLGDISHELFTPIARLQMAVELIDEFATPEQVPLINDVREEIEEMTSLVNELLAFSKAGMQGQKKELIEVNLSEIIEPLVAKLGIKTQTEINVAKSLCVLSDKLLLERSISNILRNSIRYAGIGPIVINASRTGDTVNLTFTDSGPGVPEESLAHLGEPFFRPESSRNRSSGGFGLGLAIVKTCIEACEGKIVLSNRLGSQSGLQIEIWLKTCPT